MKRVKKIFEERDMKWVKLSRVLSCLTCVSGMPLYLLPGDVEYAGLRKKNLKLQRLLLKWLVLYKGRTHLSGMGRNNRRVRERYYQGTSSGLPYQAKLQRR
jgi:hypothetical protein